MRQRKWHKALLYLGPSKIHGIGCFSDTRIEKGAFVRAQGLGGTIIWTISQGHIASAPAGQRDPLLDAIRSAFLE